MHYRSFGKTDWMVSEIAFGGWQIGGTWGDVDDEESISTLLHSYESGINFVDTAELYGSGRSETVIGESLRRWNGNKIYVATKVQPLRWPDPDDDAPLMRGRYPEWHLRESVEIALSRLGVERLDLLQLHCWAPDLLHSLDWLETLNALRLEGKVDRIGVSIRDYRPDEGIDLAKLDLVTSVQVIFNIFEQRPALAGGLFEACAVSGMAGIARVPLDSGSLSGAWNPATYASWEVGSVPYELFRNERFGETLAKAEELKKIVAPYYSSLAEAAMRYSLSSPQVSTVIPGMRNPKNVDRNVAYSDGQPFASELIEKLREFNWPRNYYK